MKDPLLDELWWTGWCQEESLGAVAAEFHQLIELGLGFEAFGHDAHPQGVGQVRWSPPKRSN